MVRKKNKDKCTETSILTGKINDIVNLIDAGITNIIIALVITNKYNEDTTEDFVKTIRNEFFAYEGMKWINRKTGKIVTIDEKIMEAEALKLINQREKAL